MITAARLAAVLDESNMMVVAEEAEPGPSDLRVDEATETVDHIHLDDGLRVVGVRRSLPPSVRAEPVPGASWFLQVPGGSVDLAGVRLGHRMGFILVS